MQSLILREAACTKEVLFLTGAPLKLRVTFHGRISLTRFQINHLRRIRSDPPFSPELEAVARFAFGSELIVQRLHLLMFSRTPTVPSMCLWLEFTFGHCDI